MKKMIAVLVICLSIFLVYYFNKDTKIYYVALGTIENDYYKQVKKNLENAKIMEKSNFLFLKKENTIKGLTVQINNNQTVNEQTIKNALIKADLITIYLEPQIISDNEFDFAVDNLKSIGADIIVLDMEPIDVSSTLIRNSSEIDKYLTPEIAEYIKENNLYGR